MTLSLIPPRLLSNAIMLMLFFSTFRVHAIPDLDWHLQIEQASVKVWQAQDEHDNIWVKAETVAAAPYWSLLNLLRDTENATQWIDKVIQVKAIPNNDLFTDLVYSEFHVPWPFRNRMMSTRSQLVFTQQPASLTIKVMQHPPLQKNPELVAMENVKGQWQAEWISPETSLIIWFGTAQPGGNLPNWIAQNAMKKSTLKTFLALGKKIAEKKYHDKPLAYLASE